MDGDSADTGSELSSVVDATVSSVGGTVLVASDSLVASSVASA